METEYRICQLRETTNYKLQIISFRIERSVLRKKRIAFLIALPSNRICPSSLVKASKRAKFARFLTRFDFRNAFGTTWRGHNRFSHSQG